MGHALCADAFRPPRQPIAGTWTRASEFVEPNHPYRTSRPGCRESTLRSGSPPPASVRQVTFSPCDFVERYEYLYHSMPSSSSKGCDHSARERLATRIFRASLWTVQGWCTFSCPRCTPKPPFIDSDLCPVLMWVWRRVWPRPFLLRYEHLALANFLLEGLRDDGARCSGTATGLPANGGAHPEFCLNGKLEVRLPTTNLVHLSRPRESRLPNHIEASRFATRRSRMRQKQMNFWSSELTGSRFRGPCATLPN